MFFETDESIDLMFGLDVTIHGWFLYDPPGAGPIVDGSYLATRVGGQPRCRAYGEAMSF